MLEQNLKQRSLDDLLILLAASERNLELSKLYKQGAAVIQQNKNQLEKVQKAIVDKRGNTFQVKK
jgi:hypothetical protein